MGEAPVAFLVCSEAIDEGKLERYCRGQLASYKLPRRVRFVEELPRNAMGKVQKHLLPRGGEGCLNQDLRDLRIFGIRARTGGAVCWDGAWLWVVAVGVV